MAIAAKAMGKPFYGPSLLTRESAPQVDPDPVSIFPPQRSPSLSSLLDSCEVFAQLRLACAPAEPACSLGELQPSRAIRHPVVAPGCTPLVPGRRLARSFPDLASPADTGPPDD